jgi:hypothetical protein
VALAAIDTGSRKRGKDFLWSPALQLGFSDLQLLHRRAVAVA